MASNTSQPPTRDEQRVVERAKVAASNATRIQKVDTAMQKWVADNVLNSISEVMRVIITTIYVGVSAWSTMVASSTTIMTIMFVLWLKKLIGYLEFYDRIIIPVATINNYIILPNYYHNIWVLYGSKTHILPYTFTASKYYMSFFETRVSIYLVVF